METNSTAEKSNAMPSMTIGCDVGDRTSQLCLLDNRSLGVLQRLTIRTTPAAFDGFFSRVQRCRVIVEVGTHSRWMSELVAGLGHEVLVANPRQLPLIYRGPKKTDRTDAEHLARIGLMDPKLLCPIKHRSKETQLDLSMVRARDLLVRERVRLVNHARGIVKPLGARLPKCATTNFASRVKDEIPKELLPVLGPVLQLLEQINVQIAHYDRRLVERARQVYPETQRLEQVDGVGELTALAYVLTVEDKDRFRKSRDAGAFLGLVPRKSQTGNSDPELHITKAGDRYLRTLLVNCAHRILGPFGKDSDLRRYGIRIAGNGKNAKKRAVIAVARKLAVLLHKLWVTGEAYQPLGYHSPSQRRAA